MRPGRIVALVIGCLLVIPAIALLFGGGALGLGYAFGRGDDGYFDTTLDRLETETVAITAEDITFAAEPGSPDWILDALDADVRLRAENVDGTTDIFVGIAREQDLDRYLAGVAHDEVVDVRDEFEPVLERTDGSSTVAPPTDQTFWEVSATGPSTQELEWEARTGRWAAVVMNADGSAGVLADVNVGAKAAFVLPLALILLGAGTVLIAAAIALIVVGAQGAGDQTEPQTTPPIRPVGAVATSEPHPVRLQASLDSDLSRWKWLVKWFLAIPHVVVLAFLWMAFVVLTIVAGVAILFTGRYPRGIFDFNVGVLRWSWRVNHYATTGGLGTDRYPPFSLQPDPDERASLDIVYPERLSRGLVLVKWLLAIPHLVIVAILIGGSVRWLSLGGDRFEINIAGGGGLLGLLGIAAGVMLLFTGTYPHALFDLIIGLNRWLYRVTAYVALMTDTYPPFRLDQGGSEVPAEPTPPPPSPAGDDLDLRRDQTEPERVYT